MGKIGLSRVLKKVVRRMLSVQNLWSYKYMQLYGYLFAIIPVYRFLYGKEEMKQRLIKEWSYFNTQPYMSSYILALHSKMLLLNEDETKIVSMRNSLMAPLASIGDSFFWFNLRTFLIAFCTLSVALLIEGFKGTVFIALAIGLAFFNYVHFYYRMGGFKRTFRHGRLAFKFTKKFYFFEKSLNYSSYLMFVASFSLILSRVFEMTDIKTSIWFYIFIFFMIADYLVIKYIKREWSVFLFNLAVAVLLVTWGII